MMEKKIENRGFNFINQITNRNSYSNMVEGTILYNKVERVVLTSNTKTIFSVVQKLSKVYLYVGDNEEPIDVVIKTCNIVMHQDGRSCEAIVGINIPKTNKLVHQLEQDFKRGMGFTIKELHEKLESEYLIDYKGLELHAIKSMNK